MKETCLTCGYITYNENTGYYTCGGFERNDDIDILPLTIIVNDPERSVCSEWKEVKE